MEKQQDDYSGRSVSLSSDGTIVAIGAPDNDGDNGSNSGHVRIYEYDGTTWDTIGNDIDGEAADDYSGRSVSLSSDGTIVAIGVNYNDGNIGHVRIFQWNRTSWTQLGNTIPGEAAYNYSGQSVSLSSDGMIVAIGAPYNDSDNGSDSGHVRIHQYDGTTWTQLGQDINGEKPYDYSGMSVSLSDDGTIVAIGATDNDGNGNNSGHVRVYKYDGTSWTQLGGDINGAAAGDESGKSVSLSSDGMIVAIGAPYNDGDNGSNSGHVRIHQYDGTNWTQLGTDINGAAAGDYSGYSVSLSADADGTIVAIGAPKNDDNDNNSGHVKIYKISPVDCIGSFGAFDSCSAPCGGGTQSRTYTIQTNAEHGGATCPYTNGHIDTQNCNTQPCPIDCEGSFGEYETCSKPCGGGKQERVYTVTQSAQNGGRQCPYTNGHIDTQNCNTQPCPIDCKGYFEDFNICSEDCGENGFKLKKFIVETQAQNGGKQCTYYNKEILQNETITDSQYVSEPCNRQPCTTYPHKLIIKNTLTEKDIELQKIRYNILDRQSKLNILTNNFNTINSNISDLKNNSNYIPDDNTLKFF